MNIMFAYILCNKDVLIDHVSFITKFLKIDYACFARRSCAEHFDISKRIYRGKIQNDTIRLAIDLYLFCNKEKRINVARFYYITLNILANTLWNCVYVSHVSVALYYRKDFNKSLEPDADFINSKANPINITNLATRNARATITLFRLLICRLLIIRDRL